MDQFLWFVRMFSPEESVEGSRAARKQVQARVSGTGLLLTMRD